MKNKNGKNKEQVIVEKLLKNRETIKQDEREQTEREAIEHIGTD